MASCFDLRAAQELAAAIPDILALVYLAIWTCGNVARAKLLLPAIRRSYAPFLFTDSANPRLPQSCGAVRVSCITAKLSVCFICRAYPCPPALARRDPGLQGAKAGVFCFSNESQPAGGQGHQEPFHQILQDLK